MLTPRSWLILFLKLGGVMMMFALVGVFMPRSLMEQGHRMIGMGEFPESPIMEYLARATSAFYTFFGVILWICSTDVRRYKTITDASAVFLIALSAVVLVYGFLIDLPMLYFGADVVTAVGLGAILLFLNRRIPNEAKAEAKDEA
ncbi:MAG: hypothetical protein ACLFVU_14990 [Phycisphaerae bacterium]